MKRPAAGVTYPRLVQLALELPGVGEGTSYGTPALRVKGKYFLRLREDGETVALRLPIDERDALLQADPKTFFITDHYRAYPAILFRLAVIEEGQLSDLLEEAWRALAPKNLLRLQ